MCGGDCYGAPLLPLAYVLVNIAFNVLALTLVRTIGGVGTGLALMSIVPITLFVFTLPLPLLQPAALGPGFAAGAALLTAGLLVYNAAGLQPLWARLLPLWPRPKAA